MKITKTTSIGEIVADNLRTAEYFKQEGIDFCCHGNRKLYEVTQEQNKDFDQMVTSLETFEDAEVQTAIDFRTMPYYKLIAHILEHHHEYIREKGPIILDLLDKIVEVHGDKHTELYEVRKEFIQCFNALEPHLAKEEMVLFPMIQKYEVAKNNHAPKPQPPYGTIANPIGQMMSEHAMEGDRFVRLHEMTNHFTVPSDGCDSYKLTYSMLKDFEHNLNIHIHLENNILFPRAEAMEQESL